MSDGTAELWADLPGNLSSHLELTVIALAVGIAVSLPLALLLVRRPPLRYPILTTVGVIQTVPSLALLALMVPLLATTDGLGLGLAAFGFYPALFALTLYGLLPILRNAVTGILGVDRDITEAARAVGMTQRQILLWVELPLAAPVILAGIRTAAIWLVGIATLATPVGQRCLGNYIFAGLQTQDWTRVMFGVVSAAALAILLDVLIGGLQHAVEHRKRALRWVTGGGLVALLVVGLLAPYVVASAAAPVIAAAPTAQTADSGSADDSAATGPIRIGAKAFTEQYILMSLLEQSMAARGLASKRVESLGSNIVFDALSNGDIDVYIDYSGTLWANAMKRTQVPARWRVLAEMDSWLAREHGIRNLGALGFENAYALVMRRDRAAELGITTIGDLARVAPELAMGADFEFYSRPEWTKLRDTYGLSLRDRKSYDPTLMYPAVVEGEVDVITAFSSDGRIAAYDLVILEDPREALPPYDAVLLLAPAVADRRDLVAALTPLVGTISVATMQQANLMVDRKDGKKSPTEAARWLLGQISGPSEPPTQ